MDQIHRVVSHEVVRADRAAGNHSPPVGDADALQPLGEVLDRIQLPLGRQQLGLEDPGLESNVLQLLAEIRVGAAEHGEIAAPHHDYPQTLGPLPFSQTRAPR